MASKKGHGEVKVEEKIKIRVERKGIREKRGRRQGEERRGEAGLTAKGGDRKIDSAGAAAAVIDYP